MSEKEVWKDVAGYAGIYQISSLGRLKNIRRHRMMNPSINGSGYVVASLSKDGKCSMVRVHRLVAKAFLPQKHSDLRLVNHKDGNKTNNVVHNLEWVTPKINSVHALETGLINNEVVVQLGVDGVILGFYHSAREASKKRVLPILLYRRLSNIAQTTQKLAVMFGLKVLKSVAES
jgi:hypothetical protein